MEKQNNSIISSREINQLLELLHEENIVEEKNEYVKPQFVPLTQEEIDDIHIRGYITQEEAVKEWNKLDLCIPGNAGVNLRCKKFNHNCDDCLIDYSLRQKEYVSFMNFGSIVSVNEVNSLINALSTDEENGYQKIKK